MLRKALLLAAVLTLSGCATVGKAFTAPTVELSIGMTEEAFVAQVHYLYRPNRTVTAYGTMTQYVSVSSGVRPRYVYFENGVLTAWQD